MKSTLAHPVFLLALLIFLLNQALEGMGIFLRFIHSYSDDLMCLPVVLTPALAGLRYFLGSQFCLPVSKILTALVLFSVTMEIILPLFSFRHIADAADVVMYALGGAAFHFLINRPLNDSSDSFTSNPIQSYEP
jgi:hypothetical protein